MASQREITKNETLIEFKHTNGYVKLAKIESRPIDVYGLYHLNRRVTVYVIQYSSNGINWSTDHLNRPHQIRRPGRHT